jgi:hypothetical protein
MSEVRFCSMRKAQGSKHGRRPAFELVSLYYNARHAFKPTIHKFTFLILMEEFGSDGIGSDL